MAGQAQVIAVYSMQRWPIYKGVIVIEDWDDWFETMKIAAYYQKVNRDCIPNIERDELVNECFIRLSEWKHGFGNVEKQHRLAHCYRFMSLYVLSEFKQHKRMAPKVNYSRVNFEIDGLGHNGSKALVSIIRGGEYFVNLIDELEFVGRKVNLKPAQTELLKLYFVEGENRQDIANKLNIKPNSVNMNLKNTIKSIRRQIRYTVGDLCECGSVVYCKKTNECDTCYRKRLRRIK